MSTPNAATAARRRHDEFVAFLDRIGYEPQGRYAKAGKLRREDVETLMQGGALDHIWSWVQHNIKSTEAINMLRRNLHVSHQALTSPDAMELKKRRIAALTEKRRLLHDAVSKLQAENKQAIANLVSVEQAMTSICDPPIQALLEDTYWLQSYGDELVLELKSLDAAAAAAADHMSAMASFETRLDHAHTSVASAFRTNRALVVDILDRQSKLLLFLQSEVVDAFKVGSYYVRKLEAAKAAFDAFLQSSPCFAVLSWEELLEQVREVDAIVSDEMLPDMGRMEEAAAELLYTKLPALFRAIHNWTDEPAKAYGADGAHRPVERCD
ncbi:hypothetical protein DYB28_002234 [Aphanomyces astaci]|uniref:Uncharacterized protein n=1 Tax=Aphanomyces astaci TaxID=112090 RepID=A0A9X8E832_APHAT|nr:hypothetical protein DYB28_002234 [Aphanomyces astaci]